MRYGVMCFLLLLFVVGVGHAQDKKGKDDKAVFIEPKEVLGKTFKEWESEIHAKDPSRREEAMKTILLFGPDRAYEAVPAIIKEINKYKTSNVDLAVRVNGIKAITMILPHQKNPDPAVLKDALAVYKMCLKDTQAIMRYEAVKGLPAVGPIAHEAIDDVVRVANDIATWELRKEGLQTLTIIGFDDKGVPTPKLLPELRKALEDSSLQVRLTALTALGAASHAKLMKAEEASILTKLNSHLASETDKIGIIWTHVTIMSAGKKVGKEHVGPIAAALKDADPKVRNQALTALAMMGEKAKPWAAAAVEQALDDPEPSIAMSAIVTLVQMHATEAIPTLQKIVANKKANQALRDHAEEAVDQLKLLLSKAKEK
jgi:HEAT repeat protein